MQDLRLVGVHDDGTHLLLSGTGGEIYRLRIDEALRVASTRTPKRAAGNEPASPAVKLSPRDIQARIRAGATAEEVAEASGLGIEHIRRYEGPVLAEREYIAEQARKVEVAAPLSSHDGYRSAFGDNPATLAEMVGHRLTALGIDSSTVEWDAWRRPDGTWTVVASFQNNAEHPVSIGEEPPAKWVYNPSRKSIQNSNRWAQQLSELEVLDGPLPARRLTAVADRPFDFEADAPADGGTDDAAGEPAGQGQDGSDELLDMLRSRRGQRLGLDEDADDALAIMLTHGIPAAHPRAEGIETFDAPSSPFPLSLAPAPENEDTVASLPEGVSTHTREITISAAPRTQSRPPEAQRPAEPAKPKPAAEPSDDTQERRSIRPKRSSVPSWDEIVFGTKSD
ncbi:DUF3071 domain-containing protein [Paenarthrobacter sp. DKR-5]|uniref:septation protein SepH n=1 Tax=Paenarthrobacter sp. DKR-5 TaxID=2835535 RepID=UPI001BDCCD43|nr:septation protein SepH [Paenarthrobacter sp. DKR-5]MBT1002093.1 DUF3071 domain-containing protein [Paenarthrobacter sp. DKR-5]